MWSPNELLKTEKQRDILSYITLQFFPFKKVPLEHYPNADGFFQYFVCHAYPPSYVVLYMQRLLRLEYRNAVYNGF